MSVLAIATYIGMQMYVTTEVLVFTSEQTFDVVMFFPPPQMPDYT